MKLLLIEDEPSLRLGISKALERAGHQVLVSDSGSGGLRQFRNEGFDIVITDLVLPDMSGMEVLQTVKDISPDTGVVIVTAYANVKTAVEAMRQGAYDYLSKPFDPAELLIVIDRFAKHRRLELDNTLLKEELRDTRQFQSLIGSSPAMLSVYETIRTVAQTDSSVIVYGETGTGKELVANAVHQLSPRSDKPFIKLNCAAIPDTLLESELFGHEKGAFTGAHQRKKGKLETANGGTVFFDEIGDMPQAVQAKLLRVLENMTFERLGGHEQIAVNVRLVYATRRNLMDEISAGRFREDLYYRINVVPVTLPPLRERKEDLPELSRHFLNLFCAKSGRKGLIVTPAAEDLLSRYDYPGNIRELKHAMEMAVALCSGGSIGPEHLPVPIRGSVQQQEHQPADAPTLADQMKRLERDLITQALDAAGGKKSLAAAALGISRKTLWRKLKDHGFPDAVLAQED